MYESLGSQFFGSTAGILSSPDAFDESRFIMTFLISLRDENIVQFQISSRRENR